MNRVESLATTGTAGAVAAQILGVVPDILSCIALVIGIVLSLWLIRKARADTKLAEKNVEFKQLEIDALLDKDRRKTPRP